jgi:hypothetical protein
MWVVFDVSFWAVMLPGVRHGSLGGNEPLAKGFGSGGYEGHGTQEFPSVASLHFVSNLQRNKN